MKNSSKSLPLLGYACGLGGNDPLCSQGPTTIKESPYLQIPHYWVDILKPKIEQYRLAALTSITDLSQRLAERSFELSKNKTFFVTIGGDHTSAIGTWSGISSSLEPNRLGLLWIDAHPDSHTFETTPSGNLHGMPVAVLLGKGEPSLINLCNMAPKILPENVCILGARSFEPDEIKLLQKLSVKIYYMEEIRDRGFLPVFLEALNKIKQNSVGFGISLDLDAIDPEQAPGVSTPVDGGINLAELYPAIDLVAKDPLCLAAEIAEFNPSRDKDHKTEKLITTILQLFSSGINKRAQHE
jgi:arginase